MRQRFSTCWSSAKRMTSFSKARNLPSGLLSLTQDTDIEQRQRCFHPEKTLQGRWSSHGSSCIGKDSQNKAHRWRLLEIQLEKWAEEKKKDVATVSDLLENHPFNANPFKNPVFPTWVALSHVGRFCQLKIRGWREEGNALCFRRTLQGQSIQCSSCGGNDRRNETHRWRIAGREMCNRVSPLTWYLHRKISLWILSESIMFLEYHLTDNIQLQLATRCSLVDIGHYINQYDQAKTDVRNECWADSYMTYLYLDIVKIRLI